MTVTSSDFFGAAFIAFGLYVVLKRKITLGLGETDSSAEVRIDGWLAVVAGILLMAIGVLIASSDAFRRFTIFAS